MIETLVALQAIDSRHQNLLRQIDEHEAELASLRTEVGTRQQELETMRVAVAAIATKRRELEALTQDEERRLKDRRMRIDRIRNDRELDAAQREIDGLKEALGRHEEELIAVMEQSETSEASILITAGECSAREGELAAVDERCTLVVRTLRADIQTDSLEREQLATRIEAGQLRRYETLRQRDRRAGLAVVEMREGCCVGCQMRLPPQLANEILAGRSSIACCPRCNRIVFHRDDSESAATSA